jgi:cytochrome c oxidase subunit IV
MHADAMTGNHALKPSASSVHGGGAGRGGDGNAHHGGDAPGSHASPAFYWVIGGILTVITAVEVAIFYIPFLEPVLVPSLLILSAGKFLLVVMYFMHLKFDHRIFTGVFLSGMVLATFMTVALIVLYHVLPAFDVMG